MQEVTIYHNPRCSKSRESLKLLQEQGVEPKIIEYLNTPPDGAEIKKILNSLALKPREFMRSNEKVYKELNLGNTDLTADELIDAMVENPILIQRPIIVKGDQAVIGRPPENVLSLL